ncbi:hypothetical protein [Devosia nitrariae]|uniref:Polymerase nucleotidyl transferase domain-containing protein n=1 Tax=Devosia nitrariae TaxID=2071872 RepID=A0ABQ5W1Q7_9HYPH|nr:hypothetical protein [Devosia nitrariae]GLQ53778.1 hypothetical protein GCM10010862_10370 [Devosia nitrariae]
MTDLLEAQQRLQAEADAVVRELELEELLGALGRPVRVGSSAMGLMVRRDIDITIVCPNLDADLLEAFAGVAARLMRKTAAVQSVRFRNDCGAWNREPDKYPHGLYLGLTVRAADEALWTLDIWAVDQPARQPDLAHLETLLPRLTDTHRHTILAIKHVLAQRPQHPPSALVYEAVVDNAIATADEFDAWQRARAQ